LTGQKHYRPKTVLQWGMLHTRHMHSTLPILPLKWPIYTAFIHYSAMDQARSMKFGSKYV